MLLRQLKVNCLVLLIIVVSLADCKGFGTPRVFKGLRHRLTMHSEVIEIERGLSVQLLYKVGVQSHSSSPDPPVVVLMHGSAFTADTWRYVFHLFGVNSPENILRELSTIHNFNGQHSFLLSHCTINSHTNYIISALCPLCLPFSLSLL